MQYLDEEIVNYKQFSLRVVSNLPCTLCCAWTPGLIICQYHKHISCIIKPLKNGKSVMVGFKNYFV